MYYVHAYEVVCRRQEALRAAGPGTSSYTGPSIRASTPLIRVDYKKRFDIGWIRGRVSKPAPAGSHDG